MNDSVTGLVKAAEFRHILMCSNCGRMLRMKSGCQLPDRVSNIRSETGDVLTFIEPCRHCIAIEVQPALDIKAALAKLKDI